MKLSLFIPSLALFSTVATASPLSNNQKRDGPACYTELGTDRFGGDYSQLYLTSFEECSAACQNDVRCVTAQYVKDLSMCYLKNSLNQATSDSRVDSVVCRASQSPASTTTTSATTTSQIPGPTACAIVRGTDYFGGDYDSFSTGTFESCAEACQNDVRCVTAQYVKDLSMCYKKSVLNEATSDSRVDSAVCRAPQLPASTTTTSATTTSQIPGPTACAIVRGTDYFGGDYDSFSTGTFESCAEACQNDVRCVTAQYVKDLSMCYKKSVLNEATSDSRVDSAVCRAPLPASTTTSSTTTASTTTSSSTISTITSSTATTSPTPAPLVCSIYRDTDFSGGDYDSFTTATFEDCVQACQVDDRCVTAAYRKDNSLCYLKGDSDAPFYTQLVDSATCRPTDEVYVGCIIYRDINIGGLEYYDSFPYATFEDCARACQADDRCIAAPYQKDIQTCFLLDQPIYQEYNENNDSLYCVNPRPPASTTTSSTTTSSTTTSSTTTSSTTTSSTTTTSTTTASTTTSSTTAAATLVTTTALSTTATTTTSATTPSCTIIRQVDYFGGDYDSISVPSFDECVSACKLDSRCVTAQFRIAYQRCYLKSSLTTESNDADVDTVICRGPVQVGISSSTITVSVTTTAITAPTTSASTTTTTESATTPIESRTTATTTPASSSLITSSTESATMPVESSTAATATPISSSLITSSTESATTPIDSTISSTATLTTAVTTTTTTSATTTQQSSAVTP